MGMSMLRRHLLPLLRRVLNSLGNAPVGTPLLNVLVEQDRHNITRVHLRNAMAGTHLRNVLAMGFHKPNVLEEALLPHHQQVEHVQHQHIAQVETGSSGRDSLISSVLALLLADLPSREVILQQHGPRIELVVRGPQQRVQERRDTIQAAHTEEGVQAVLHSERRRDAHPLSRRNQRVPSQSHHRLW